MRNTSSPIGPPAAPAAELRRSDGALGTRGAVFVEFLIAFLPLFLFFLSIVQFTFVEIASFIVDDAAVKAARAAAVVVHDDPKFYDGVAMGDVSGARKAAIERAAKVPLMTLGVDPSAVRIVMKDTYDRDEMITVQVEYDYGCRVPGARLLVCRGGTLTLRAESSMPNQGAEFEYW